MMGTIKEMSVTPGTLHTIANAAAEFTVIAADLLARIDASEPEWMSDITLDAQAGSDLYAPNPRASVLAVLLSIGVVERGARPGVGTFYRRKV